DSYVGWLLGALPAGLSLVRRYQPQVLWTTYPIATANLIGLALRKLTGLPWIADLRDPMTDDFHPTDPLKRKIYRWIERKTVHHCTLAVCTTPGAIDTYTARYPELPRSRFTLIENGYDEENFRSAGDDLPPRDPAQPFTLIHSGIIYPSERDPAPLFAALSELKAEGAIDASRLRVVLRATAHDGYVNGLLAQYGIQDLVSTAPHVAYRDALREMLTADGLLILQASNCNHQIPAKLYEYLRANRPILALTDSAGDTAATLRSAGVDSIAPLDDKDGIKAGLQRFLALAMAGQAPLPSAAAVAGASRRSRSMELATLLDRLSPAPGYLPASAGTKEEA
ncbi:MAG TPA: glycosyltransferase, partial [Burkholderiaceae bacterium]